MTIHVNECIGLSGLPVRTPSTVGVFTAQELAPLVSNCTGTKGKKALDQHKLRTIKELVMNLYDIPIKNQEEVWKGCVRAIDEFLRRSNRSRVQKKD